MPHFMASAVVSTAVLALGALFFLEREFNNGRDTLARPTVLSVEEALVQLRSQQFAQQRQRAQPATLLTRLSAMPRPATQASGLVSQGAAPEARTSGAPGLGAACAILRARGAHIGQTLSFRGEYLSDRRGTVVVRPIGCEEAVVVRDLDQAARSMADRVGPSTRTATSQRFVALFTATLVHAGPPGSEDDATRLSVKSITNVQVIQPAPAPGGHRAWASP